MVGTPLALPPGPAEQAATQASQQIPIAWQANIVSHHFTPAHTLASVVAPARPQHLLGLWIGPPAKHGSHRHFRQQPQPRIRDLGLRDLWRRLTAGWHSGDELWCGPREEGADGEVCGRAARGRGALWMHPEGMGLGSRGQGRHAAGMGSRRSC